MKKFKGILVPKNDYSFPSRYMENYCRKHMPHACSQKNDLTCEKCICHIDNRDVLFEYQETLNKK